MDEKVCKKLDSCLLPEPEAFDAMICYEENNGYWLPYCSCFFARLTVIWVDTLVVLFVHLFGDFRKWFARMGKFQVPPSQVRSGFIRKPSIR